MNPTLRRFAVCASFACFVVLAGRAGPSSAAISFEDRTEAAGLTTTPYAGYGSSWTDFNRDGWLDVWIGDHMYPPRLFINNGDGSFADRTGEAWMGDPLLDAHGAAWADFDNDGDPDLEELYGVNEGTAERDKPFYVNHAGRLTNETGARGLNDRKARGEARSGSTGTVMGFSTSTRRTFSARMDCRPVP